MAALSVGDIYDMKTMRKVCSGHWVAYERIPARPSRRSRGSRYRRDSFRYLGCAKTMPEILKLSSPLLSPARLIFNDFMGDPVPGDFHTVL